MNDSEIDYLAEPSGQCLKWKTHYCFSTPFGLCEQCVGEQIIELTQISDEEINQIKMSDYPITDKHSLERAIAKAQLIADRKNLERHNYSQYKPVWKRMQNKAKAELRAGNYHYRVAWSEEDGEYVGLCAEFPSLSWLAKTQEAALAGIRDTVKQAVEDMQNKAKAGPRNDLP